MSNVILISQKDNVGIVIEEIKKVTPAEDTKTAIPASIEKRSNKLIYISIFCFSKGL